MKSRIIALLFFFVITIQAAFIGIQIYYNEKVIRDVSDIHAEYKNFQTKASMCVQQMEAFDGSVQTARDSLLLQVEVARTNFVVELNAIRETTVAAMTTLSQQLAKEKEHLDARIVENAKQMEAFDKLDARFNQIISAQNQLILGLANLNGDVGTVVQSSQRNQINAEMAISMAKKAVEQGELQLAMVYALNAINHDSSNMVYIKFYNELLYQKQDLSTFDIDQFVNILDLAVFQVASSDVLDVISMKTSIIDQRDRIVSVESDARNKEIVAAVADSIAELEHGSLAISHIYANGDVNESLLKERVEALTALLADASLSQEEQKKLAEDLSYATGLYSMVTVISAVKNSVAKSDALVGKKQLTPEEILTARNQLQTANTLLSQIWSSDCSKYQDFLSMAEQLQGDISLIDKKLNLIASASSQKQIEDLIARCRNISFEDCTYTSRITRITEISKEFQPLLSSVYDLDLRKTLAAEVESLSLRVTSLSQERYKAYQEWAIKKLNEAIKQWNSTLIIKDKIAQEMFRNYIFEINPALLLPDVNSLYNNIYQIIYDQLPNKAEMQYQKATFKNVKQLEDF